jgi:hypothetical protein
MTSGAKQVFIALWPLWLATAAVIVAVVITRWL